MLLDFILEFIVSLFLEIIIDGSKESWIPKPLRVFLLILFLGIFLALTGLFIFVAVTVSNVIVKILFVGLAIGLIILIIQHVMKALK